MVGKGTKTPEDIDGISLLPLLEEKSAGLERDVLCWYYPHYSPQAQMPGYAIRKGDYKLIEHYDPPKVELFHLAKDISESDNLAEKMPEKVAELKASFEDWLKRMNPVLHTENPGFISPAIAGGNETGEH